MDNQKQDGLKRHVSIREVFPALSIVLILLSGIIASELYSKAIGASLVILALVALSISYFRIPKNDKEKIAEAISKHEKSTFVRILNFVQLVALLFLLFFFGQWLYGYL